MLFCCYIFSLESLVSTSFFSSALREWAVGGTQIEAHLLNALARGWQHRRAVVVVVVVVVVVLLVLVVDVVVVVLPLISLYPAAQQSPPSHLEYPSNVCVCVCVCVRRV